MAAKTNVLVTGGAGFIGSHVAQHLRDSGYRVVALDDLSGGFVENVVPGVEFVQGSILDTELLHGLFATHGFEHVFHLAAYAAEGLSHFIKRFNYTNNVIGSVNLINESVNHDVRCFVFTSSIAVYGTSQLPMREDMIPQPEDPYGIAKLAVEQDLKASKEMFDLDYIVFRPHNVYGERQNVGDRYRNVIGIFLNNIMQGRPLPIFGDGQQTRAFSYIDSVARLIAGSIENTSAYNEVFNVGSNDVYTVDQLADYVIEATGTSVGKEYVQARNEVTHAYADHSKVERYFAETDEVSLEEGVRRMARWALKNGARRGKDFGEIEIEKNLPPSWRNQSSEV